MRLVGLQAADAESLNQWLTALRRSRGEAKTPETERVKKVPRKRGLVIGEMDEGNGRLRWKIFGKGIQKKSFQK